MIVIETHPEELLDRELRSTLTERESHLLMAHLQRCSACRMERQLRVDFERELAVSAQSLDLQMFVSDAIDAMEQQPDAGESLAALHAAAVGAAQAPLRAAQGGGRGSWSALRPIALLMLVCVALSAGVGIGAAQLGLAGRAWQLVRDGLDATFGPAPVRRPPQAGAAREPHAPPAPASQAERAQERGSFEAPAHVPAAAPERTPVQDGDPSPSAAMAQQERAELAPAARASAGPASDFGSPSAALRQAPNAAHGLVPRVTSTAPHVTSMAPHVTSTAPQVTSTAPYVTSAAEPVPPARGAEPAARPDAAAAVAGRPLPEGPSAALMSGAARLFEEANRIRHQGRASEASGLYRELQARFPNSAEARLSVALVARLQLDQGESAAALAGFESYLASSDMALREEVMVGRVRALQRLGREDEARSAAQTLLELYPSSAFAPAARKLLEPPAP